MPTLLETQTIFVEPFNLSSGGVAPSYTVSRGTGAANLVENDPREVWVDTGAAGFYQIDIDLGVATDWDTVALVGVTAGSGAAWSIIGGATLSSIVYLSAANLLLVSEDGVADSGSSLFKSAAVINGRYIRVTISPNGAPINSIGRLIVGKSFRPTQPREQGAGRPPLDSGSRTRLDNGGLATVSGHLISGFKWVFGDLDPIDLKRLWGIYRRRRTTEPMLIVEDPTDGFAESVHYGTFVDLELYERRDQSKSRWAMTFEDWT
jgi:hypothetical protein